jgi:hypothetical protein
MQQLAGFWDYFAMLAVAMISGALGGIGFELMQTRLRNDTGALETPHRLTGGHYIDLGFWSSLFLGAITAVAVLYFFPPETQITIQSVTGQSQTTMSYDVVKLIAFSLIVGSAGPSFLTSIQARVSVALNEQKVADVHNLAQAQVEHLEQATQSDVREIHEDARRLVRDVLDKLPQMVNAQVKQAEVRASTNGGNHALFDADPLQAANYMAAPIQDTLTSIDQICNDAELKLQGRLHNHVDAAKKTLNMATSPSRQ